MKVVYTPLRIDDLSYKIEGETIYIKRQDKVYKADFTNISDGKLNSPLEFIPFAHKKNGDLTITVIQPVDCRGVPVEYKTNFEVTEYDDLMLDWLTQEEIDELNNQPRELSEIEMLKISQAEQFETILILLGGM